jgi:phage terminase large subunit
VFKTPAEKMRRWRRDPVFYVRDRFGVEPDAWQADALMAVGAGDIIRFRLALKACAGPGKTAVLAWIGWWFLTCFSEPNYHPKGAAISESWDNLKDNLWAEMQHWRLMDPFLTAQFEWTKKRIFHREYPDTWFISARSWKKTATPEEQGSALSGLHAKFVLILIDESGRIPVALMQRGEQALQAVPDDGFALMVQAGNPTSTDGMLYAACTEFADRWKVITITGDPDDPKRSPRINIDNARQLIKDWGRDNPWLMSYLLGQFPPSALNTLLGLEEVEAAMNRHYDEHEYNGMQKRLGIDVSRFGDDKTCIFPRQGLVAFNPVIMRNATGPQIAARVLRAKLKWGSEQEFFDGTGGYGASAVDAYQLAGQSPIEVIFSSAADERKRFYNKRAEIWWNMAEWVKKGGALPPIPELKKALTTTTYTLKEGRILIEPKEILKEREGYSPDEADALACTFAYADSPSEFDQDEHGRLIARPRSHGGTGLETGQTVHEHDSYAD